MTSQPRPATLRQPAPGTFARYPGEPATGELELRIALSGGKSVAVHQYHARALKVIRPHYLDNSGQVFYIVVNPGGGYVGGDTYRIDVTVETGASLLLTDQSAAKVYRTPGDFVLQEVNFTVAAGACLEYIPDQLILYRDADFRQQMTVAVEPGGSLFMSDIITPGWSPDGSQFKYRQAHVRTVLDYGGQLALVDNVRIRPLDKDFSQQRDFYLGSSTHVATALCIDEGIDEALLGRVKELVAEFSGHHPGVEAAVTATEVPGFVLRALGDRTEHLMSLIVQTASLIRLQLRGQAPVRLRQY